MSVILWFGCHIIRRLMGCATSALGIQRTSPDFDRHLLEEQELAKLTAPPPKIPLTVGSGVQKYNENKVGVVFIFGGPGSTKGAMVEELVSAYNFTVITTEDIVLNYLPNKVANTVQTTHEIKELLTTDPGLLTLDWVLHLMSARIATSNHRLFLIDVVPNLHSILRVDTFNKPDISKEISGFEKKHPCLFSLHLVVPDLSLCNSSPGILMKTNKDKLNEEDEERERQEKEKERERQEKEKDKDKDKDEKEKEKKSVFTEGSDEMDNTRLKKRFELYHSCAQPFLDYFDETGRCITVEVSPQNKEHVWKRLNDLLREYGFNCKQSNKTVVLFATNEEQIIGLDILYYKMLKVSLSALVSNVSDSLVPVNINYMYTVLVKQFLSFFKEQMIKAVYLYVRRSASSQNHLVILDILNQKCETQLRRINFLEIRECYLDHFIRTKSTTSKGKPFKKPFKSVTSASSEICLFPGEMDTEVCKKIAMCYALADNPVLNDKGDKKDSLEAQNSVENHVEILNDSLITNIA